VPTHADLDRAVVAAAEQHQLAAAACGGQQAVGRLGMCVARQGLVQGHWVCPSVDRGRVFKGAEKCGANCRAESCQGIGRSARAKGAEQGGAVNVSTHVDLVLRGQITGGACCSMCGQWAVGVGCMCVACHWVAGVFNVTM
jgi:hypothetical protein